MAGRNEAQQGGMIESEKVMIRGTVEQSWLVGRAEAVNCVALRVRTQKVAGSNPAVGVMMSPLGP